MKSSERLNTAAHFKEDSWIYGWTHYGKTGQTKARMNKLTDEVEIREQKKWIKCGSDCNEFFTSAKSLRISRFIFSGMIENGF